MKKTIAILLGALMLFGVVGCTKKTDAPAKTEEPAKIDEATPGNNPAVPDPEPDTPAEPDAPADEPAVPDPEPEPLAGGWHAAEDFEMNDETKAIFEKAVEGLLGVNYEPVALLGTQVVAGTNYCFLAKATVVYPDALPAYKLVYVYQDLEGSAKVLNVADMPVVPNEYGTADPIDTEEALMGGWAYAESPEITDEIKASLEKAVEGLLGASYTPVANLGTQVVAGLNRCVLCKITPVVANPVSHYALVYLYENLEGSTELSDVLDFDFGELCTYGA